MKYDDSNTTQQECIHNPSKKASILERFGDFILHRESLYFWHDDSAHCAKCNTPILVPVAFYCPLLKLAYFWVAIVAHTLFFSLIDPYLHASVFIRFLACIIWFCVIMLLFDRVITAALFSSQKWNTYDSKNENVEYYWRQARNNRHGKTTATLLASLVFIGIAQNHPSIYFTIPLAILGIIVSLTRNRFGSSIFFISVIFYSVISLFFIQWSKNAALNCAEHILSIIVLSAELFALFSMPDSGRIKGNKKSNGQN